MLFVADRKSWEPGTWYLIWCFVQFSSITATLISPGNPYATVRSSAFRVCEVSYVVYEGRSSKSGLFTSWSRLRNASGFLREIGTVGHCGSRGRNLTKPLTMVQHSSSHQAGSSSRLTANLSITTCWDRVALFCVYALRIASMILHTARFLCVLNGEICVNATADISKFWWATHDRWLFSSCFTDDVLVAGSCWSQNRTILWWKRQRHLSMRKTWGIIEEPLTESSGMFYWWFTQWIPSCCICYWIDFPTYEKTFY